MKVYFSPISQSGISQVADAHQPVSVSPQSNHWELTFDELLKVNHITLYRHVPKIIGHYLSIEDPGKWWSREPSFLSNPNKNMSKFYFLKITLTAEELAESLQEREGETWLPQDVRFERSFQHPAEQIEANGFEQLKSTFPNGHMPVFVYLDRSKEPKFKVLGGEDFWLETIDRCIEDGVRLPASVISDYRDRIANHQLKNLSNIFPLKSSNLIR